MMTKITLSVPEQIVIQMKEVAKKRKTSISKMFTQYVQLLTIDEGDEEKELDKLFPIHPIIKSLPRLSLSDEEIAKAKDEYFAKKYGV